MAFDFSTLVTDRTQQDVAYVRQLVEKLVTGTATEEEKAEWNSFTLKGVYNHTDLNRVTAAMEDLKLRLEGYGYAVPGYQRVVVPHVIPESKPTSRLPEGYIELAWIESTGSQYINSNYTPTGTTTMKATVLQYAANANVEQAVFGHSNSGFEMGFGATNQVFLYSKASASYYSPNTVYDVVFDMTGIVSETSPYKKLIVSLDGGVEATSTTANNANWKNGVITLFALKGQYNFTGRLYCASIYDSNNVCVRDFIPCINPSGVVGLFDVVNQQFYGNSGTGAFVAGAIPRELPEGYTQVEYIQSSGTQYIDTGVAHDSTKSYVLNADVSYDTVSLAHQIMGFTGNGGCGIGLANAAWWEASSIASATVGTRYYLEWSASNTNWTRIVNGQTASGSNRNTNFTSNMYLFAALSTAGSTSLSYYCSCKLYSAKVLVNGSVVRDYVPCRSQYGEVGLYDLVSNVFYQNAGSGAFSAGYEVASPVTAAVAAVAVVSNDLTEYDPYAWYEFDWPTTETMTVYLLNVSAIRAVLDMLPTTPKTPDNMKLLTWAEANDIEQILFDVETVIYQVVNGFQRSGAFTFWSGHKPLPSATSDKGRTWEELDAMNTTWANWQVADWYLLLYGNLRAEGVID